MGWSFPWASSFGSDFNFDFQVARTEEQQQSGVVEYNFRANDVRPWLEAGKEGPLAEIAAGLGTDWATYTREAPGMSAFALEAGVVYHVHSTYARGLDGLWACTGGSTGRHVDATRRTRRGSGSAATMSTTASDAGGRLRHRPAPVETAGSH